MIEETKSFSNHDDGWEKYDGGASFESSLNNCMSACSSRNLSISLRKLSTSVRSDSLTSVCFASKTLFESPVLDERGRSLLLEPSGALMFDVTLLPLALLECPISRCEALGPKEVKSELPRCLEGDCSGAVSSESIRWWPKVATLLLALSIMVCEVRGNGWPPGLWGSMRMFVPVFWFGLKSKTKGSIAKVEA